METPENYLTKEQFIELYEQAQLPGHRMYEASMKEYIKLNATRFHRILENYKADEETRKSIKELLGRNKIFVDIIAEPWCGDVAQILPVVFNMFEDVVNAEIRIFLRDSNEKLMNRYLTDGHKKSITIIIIRNKEGEECFHWGPRPGKAQEIFYKTWQETSNKDNAYRALQNFYNQDKGKSIEKELIELFEKHRRCILKNN